ncbi:MAG: PspA/IM30 family protein [Kiritimatiellae bacterium]|nr:PspA/IM30 family protein [Kiritimatiellia bacterium]
MSILKRIQSLLRANMHVVLDKLESPERMLNQRIRELEKALREAKHSAAAFAVALKKMEKETEQFKRLRDEWENRAEQAVAVGDDDLAKRALTEKLKMAEKIDGLAPAIERNKATSSELRASLVELQDQLQMAKLKQTELLSRKHAAAAQKTFGSHLEPTGDSAAAMAEMTKLEDKVAESEAEVAVEREIREAAQGVSRELSEKTRELEVEAQLAALKKRKKKSG